jgi:hypothetical protein
VCCCRGRAHLLRGLAEPATTATAEPRSDSLEITTPRRAAEDEDEFKPWTIPRCGSSGYVVTESFEFLHGAPFDFVTIEAVEKRSSDFFVMTMAGQ